MLHCDTVCMNNDRDVSFKTSSVHGIPLVLTRGNIDVSNAATFELMLEKAAYTTSPSNAMIVNLEHCSYFDSVAVGVLIKFLRITTKNRVVLVATPQSALAKVLEMVGFGRMCAIAPSVDAALSAVAVSAA